MLKEVAEKFIAWTKLKIRLHQKDPSEVAQLYFREKEIWWVHLGKNIGYEEDGKNENFDRPVIILRKFNRHLFWGIPTSTKIKTGNQFYYKFKCSDHEYSAILSQLKPMSANRLIRKIGGLSTQEFDDIKTKTSGLIKNDSRINE